MRQSKFIETQAVSILKETDADRPVNEIWRTYGISSATYLPAVVRLLGDPELPPGLNHRQAFAGVEFNRSQM